MASGKLIYYSAASLLVLAPATLSWAQTIETRPLDLGGVGESRIVEDTITGNEIVDFQLKGERSQILSVDLMTSNDANYFNVLPSGTQEAIFIGSTQGTVADVPLPESGTYVIRVYLMRSAARRGESANYSLGVGLGPPAFADSLAGGPDYWAVSGVGGDDALNVRAGPSTRYGSVGKLANGEVLQNRGCRLTGRERWCEIRATHSGLTGWVAGRYLVESAAPPSPAVPEGGPVGNGVPFDATGFVPCAFAEQPTRHCPFGVVREGPGNAGVWIALGDGSERHILFEGGKPVAASPAAALTFEKTGDLFVVRVGEERYEIPDAVVSGG
jgi:uncharacterized protein YraI